MKIVRLSSKNISPLNGRLGAIPIKKEEAFPPSLTFLPLKIILE